MKKLFFVCLFLCVAVFSFGQGSVEHMKFMGIPLDGPMNEFVAKLKKKGMVEVSSSDNSVLLKGSFAGNSKCNFFIQRLPKKDIVESVLVSFPESNTWNPLYIQYMSLKKNAYRKIRRAF